MIYAYCVRRAGDPGPQPGLNGIEGAAVEVCREASLDMWVSTIDVPPPPDEEALRAHERVVREALRTRTPLPLRFGTTFPSEAALERSLAENADRFMRSLERVSGLAEMGIRVEQAPAVAGRESTSDAEPGGSPQSGRAYLVRRKAEIDAAAASREDAAKVLDGIAAELSAVAVETTSSVVLRERVLGQVACLVRRPDISIFRTRVAESLVPRWKNHTLVVSGPWAPYSFVDE